MQKRIERIIKDVAKDRGLPEYVVKAIVESQFQCAREATKVGLSGEPDTFLNIRFRRLGLLVAKPGKIRKLHNLKISKQQKDSGKDQNI